MTAIGGVWSITGHSDAFLHCRSLLSGLRVYGSSSCADTHTDPSIALGYCLSESVPEDQFDRQPVSSLGGSVLVADVRLDNRPALIEKLEIPRSAAVAMADSAILFAAWERWEQECVHHLLGAFSFAVWDKRRQQVFIARDPIGERPLFYFSSSQYFAFSSMPKGLHALPFAGAEIDEEYAAQATALFRLDPQATIFRGIRNLPTGCSLIVTSQGTRLSRYWDPDRFSPASHGQDEEYLEEFLEIFDSAVRCRLRSIGKIGCELSGGLDSASVAATTARILQGQNSSFNAYTAVPRTEFHGDVKGGYFANEGPAASEIVALYPTIRHLPITSDEATYFEVMERNTWLADCPSYGGLNELWVTAIAEQAKRDGVTTLLNGKYGNITFSDYGLTNLWEWFRKGQFATLARIAWQIRRQREASLKSILRHAISPSLPLWLRRIADPVVRGFSISSSPLHPDVIRRSQLEPRALADWNTIGRGPHSLLRRVLRYGDVGILAPVNQGGWGIDLRDPLMDRRIVEFCLKLPPEQFVRGGKLRSLARRAMKGRLPETTLNRTQRGLQSADWYESLTRLRPQMLAKLPLLERSPMAARMLDLCDMREMLVHWPSESTAMEQRARYYYKLMTGFSLGLFLRKYDPDAT